MLEVNLQSTLHSHKRKHINMKTLTQYINEQLILERFLNAFNKEDMKKYADEVWELLTKAYEYCGGMAGMDSVDQLMDETDMWKMVRKNGKIIAVNTYSNKRSGRKICYGGQDGTPEGKTALKKILEEDFKLADRQSWAEVSGAMEVTALKQGAMPIPAYIAELIMKDKKFEKIHEDGFHYTRKIGDGLHTKLMVGNFAGKNFAADENLIQSLIDTAKKIGKEEGNA